MPCEPRDWTLEGRDQSARSQEASVAIRQCPQCYAVHRPAPKCPECGHVYVIQGRQVDEVEGELREIDPAAMRKARAREQMQADSLDALVELGRLRGYKSPEKWAAHVYTARQAKRGEQYGQQGN